MHNAFWGWRTSIWRVHELLAVMILLASITTCSSIPHSQRKDRRHGDGNSKGALGGSERGAHCRTAIVLLANDLNFDDSKRNITARYVKQSTSPELAQACWHQNCTDFNLGTQWLMGELVWDSILEIQGELPFDVYKIKYDYAMPTGKIEVVREARTTSIIVGRQPDSWRVSDYEVNVLTYKTALSIEYLLNLKKYSFVVRGNINIFLDLQKFQKALLAVRRRRLYTSPFIQGGSYIYGYFVLMSTDTCRWLVSQFHAGVLQKFQKEQAVKYKRRYSTGADDCDIAILTTGYLGETKEAKPYAYRLMNQTMIGGDPPRNDSNQYSLRNNLGIRLDDGNGDRGHVLTTEEALQIIDSRHQDTFLFRIKDTADHGWVRLYKVLLGELAHVR